MKTLLTFNLMENTLRLPLLGFYCTGLRRFSNPPIRPSISPPPWHSQKLLECNGIFNAVLFFHCDRVAKDFLRRKHRNRFLHSLVPIVKKAFVQKTLYFFF